MMERVLLALMRRLTATTPDGLPLAGAVVRAGLAHAFGARGSAAPATPGDPGLFGPGSPSWRVISDPAAIVGGVRALLVQLLHPLAMAGVAEHSGFRSDPMARLQRTSAYVTATTFGSTAQAVAAARAVRGVHRRVTGTAPGGRPYRAEDPELLCWVSVALTSSFLATDALYAIDPVAGADADAFVAEQSRAAALLDPRVDLAQLEHCALDEINLPMMATLPSSVAQLDACLEQFDGELDVNEQGRAALRFLLWPRVAAPVRAGYVPVLAGALASLTPRQRGLLGVPLGPAVAPLRAQTAMLVRGLRIAAGPSPALAAARRRAGERHDEADGDGRVRTAG